MSSNVVELDRKACLGIRRRLELCAYSSVVSAFRAQGDFCKERIKLLNELGSILKISIDHHKSVIRCSLADDELSSVAHCLCGPNNDKEWSREGRRIIPLIHRATPITAYTSKADECKLELSGWMNEPSSGTPTMTSVPRKFSSTTEKPSLPIPRGSLPGGGDPYGDIIVLSSGRVIRYKEAKNKALTEKTDTEKFEIVSKRRKRKQSFKISSPKADLATIEVFPAGCYDPSLPPRAKFMNRLISVGTMTDDSLGKNALTSENFLKTKNSTPVIPDVLSQMGHCYTRTSVEPTALIGDRTPNLSEAVVPVSSESVHKYHVVPSQQSKVLPTSQVFVHSSTSLSNNYSITSSQSVEPWPQVIQGHQPRVIRQNLAHSNIIPSRQYIVQSNAESANNSDLKLRPAMNVSNGGTHVVGPPAVVRRVAFSSMNLTNASRSLPNNGTRAPSSLIIVQKIKTSINPTSYATSSSNRLVSMNCQQPIKLKPICDDSLMNKGLSGASVTIEPIVNTSMITQVPIRNNDANLNVDPNLFKSASELLCSSSRVSSNCAQDKLGRIQTNANCLDLSSTPTVFECQNLQHLTNEIASSNITTHFNKVSPSNPVTASNSNLLTGEVLPTEKDSRVKNSSSSDFKTL